MARPSFCLGGEGTYYCIYYQQQLDRGCWLNSGLVSRHVPLGATQIELSFGRFWILASLSNFGFKLWRLLFFITQFKIEALRGGVLKACRRIKNIRQWTSSSCTAVLCSASPPTASLRPGSPMYILVLQVALVFANHQHAREATSLWWSSTRREVFLILEKKKRRKEKRKEGNE